MKEVMAIIRMNKINQTKKALIEAGISSMHARDCLGRGKGLVDTRDQRQGCGALDHVGVEGGSLGLGRHVVLLRAWSHTRSVPARYQVQRTGCGDA